MESPNRGVDLERELTCSICTEVLYQPLTLLDCLHSFCGACLKEWFAWQLTAARNNPNSIAAGATPYTCPSCRAPVRDTRHNATVTSLVEMILAASPEKSRTAEEKEEMSQKYTPGENVLPKVEEKEKSLRERRVDDADRRLMNEVRDMSLRDIGVDTGHRRRERRNSDSRLRTTTTTTTRSSRDNSRESRNADGRERRPHVVEDVANEQRRRREQRSLRADAQGAEGRRSGRSHDETTRTPRETEHTAVRQIEHQSSIRSLISSSDVDSHEMMEEILRQIQEEQLLEGIDLENIDVNQEDQISERIADAFRKRQREQARAARSARSADTSPSATTTHRPRVTSRENNSGSESLRPSTRNRVHSRSTSNTSQAEEQSRPPRAVSRHLDVQSGDESRRRRRTNSATRSSVSPTPSGMLRPASRSSTDLSDRPLSSQSTASRPQAREGRSTTEPLPPRNILSLTAEPRASQQPTTDGNRPPRTRSTTQSEGPFVVPAETSRSRVRAAPPAAIFVPSSVPSASSSSPLGLTLSSPQSLVPTPLSPRHPLSLLERSEAVSSASRPISSSSTVTRTRLPRFTEPSLSCARCKKAHIEYELHYNCHMCANGDYNICLSCYRAGKGCLKWFGFGRAAWAKWDRMLASGELLAGKAERPHMLTANRYIAPKVLDGGADGRRVITTDDPQKRLQSGCFCANCLVWANECYWRCDICNDDDWGFCNLCVNQGKCCTHPLLPLVYKPDTSNDIPLSPTHDQKTPSSASLLTGPGVVSIGPFKPLTFRVSCDICHYPIQPSSTRYHCFSCTSVSQPNCKPGDYDICTPCYSGLMSRRRISPENGSNGWRRCLKGHRMIITGFDDSRGSQRRVLVQDLVGGRGTHEEPTNLPEYTGQKLQMWSWADGIHMKLVTTDVAASAPTSSTSLKLAPKFPPDGGVGMKAIAGWAWYPAEGDGSNELLFPKGAEIRECMDMNGDWFVGVYMGRRAIFPSNFVRVIDQGAM